MNRTSALAYLAIFSQGPLLLGRRLAPMCLIRCHTLCIPQQVGWGRRSWGGIVKMFWQKTEDMVKKNSEGRNWNAMNFAMGYSLVWLQPWCVAEQGLVFTVLGLKQAVYTISLFSILYRVPFWTESLQMSVLIWHIDIMGESDNSLSQGWVFELLIVSRTPCTVKSRE